MARSKKDLTQGATKILATGAGVAASRLASRFVTGTSVAALQSREGLTTNATILKFFPMAKTVLGVGIAAVSKDMNLRCFGLGMAGDAAVETANSFTNNAIGANRFPYAYRFPYNKPGQGQQRVQMAPGTNRGIKRRGVPGVSGYTRNSMVSGY